MHGNRDVHQAVGSLSFGGGGGLEKRYDKIEGG
jgi:hypothetical protein